MSYDPWSDAAGREWLRLTRAALPLGMPTCYGRDGGRSVVLISTAASPAEVRFGLAQELVHDSDTVGPLPPLLRQKAEHRAQTVAADRLITEEAFLEVCRDLGEDGGTVGEVAALMDVPVAALLLWRARQRQPTTGRNSR